MEWRGGGRAQALKSSFLTSPPLQFHLLLVPVPPQYHTFLKQSKKYVVSGGGRWSGRVEWGHHQGEANGRWETSGSIRAGRRFPQPRCEKYFIQHLNEAIDQPFTPATSFAKDWGKRYAHEFLQLWKLQFTRLPLEGMTTACHVMAGIAAIMTEKFGEYWPVYCRVGLCPCLAEGSISISTETQDCLPVPKLGICALQCPSHWMLLCSTETGTFPSCHTSFNIIHHISTAQARLDHLAGWVSFQNKVPNMVHHTSL